MLKRIIAVSILAMALFGASALSENVKKESFVPQALGVEKSYWVYLPPGYEKDVQKRYPVVYLLHGYNFARNQDRVVDIEEENHWIVQEQTPQIADCLFTIKSQDELMPCLINNKVDLPEGVANALKSEFPDAKFPVPPMIIVMPDGDSSWYMNRLDGAKQYPATDGPEFVNGMRKGGTGQYETYISEDLVKEVDSKFRTVADRGHRGIGGFSMGGVGSMNLLLSHPDVFSSVTSISANYSFSNFINDTFSYSYIKGSTPDILTIFCEDASKGADCKINKKYVAKNDPLTRLKALDRKDVRIYFDAGEADFFSSKNSFDSFKKFDALLKDKGMESYPNVHVIPGNEFNAKGVHTGRYWRSRLGVILQFHAKSFDLLETSK